MDATGPPSPWAGALRGRPVRLCHPDAEHRMNLSVESFPNTPRMRSVRPPVPAEPPGPDASRAYPVREGVLAMPAVFPLEHGGELRDARLAWRRVGAVPRRARAERRPASRAQRGTARCAARLAPRRRRPGARRAAHRA